MTERSIPSGNGSNNNVKIYEYILIYSMKRTLAIAGILLVFIGIIQVFAIGTCYGTCIPGYDKPCVIFCFDENKNADTQGFDPSWLKIPQVKLDCQAALSDGEKLPYCDKPLGTL